MLEQSSSTYGMHVNFFTFAPFLCDVGYSCMIAMLGFYLLLSLVVAVTVYSKVFLLTSVQVLLLFLNVMLAVVREC